MSTHATLHHILKRLILPLLVAALALGTLPAAGNSSGSGAKHDKDKSGNKEHTGDKSGKHSDGDKSKKHDDDDHKSGKDDDDDKSGKDDDDKSGKDDDDESGKGRDDDDDDKPGKTDDDEPGQPTAPSTPGTTGAPAASGTPGTAGQPTQPAAQQPPSLVIRGTSQRSCASVRSFRIRLRENSAQRLRWARVKVNGKTVKVVRGDRLRATVNLKGLPKGRFYVRIVAMTTSGNRVSAVRAYRTCTKKQARKYKGKV